MEIFGAVQNRVIDNTWLYAVPAGVASGLYVLFNSSGPSTLDFTIVLLAGVIGGLLTAGSRATTSRVGLRTGLVASFPVLGLSAEFLGAAPSFDQPVWFGAVQVGMLLAFAAISVLLISLAGAVGALIGRWLSRTVTPTQPAADN